MFLNFCRDIHNDIKDDAKKQVYNLANDESVNVNVNMEGGWTPLHFLCERYKREDLIDLVHLLTKRGANVNAMTKSGWNPFHLLSTSFTMPILRK